MSKSWSQIRKYYRNQWRSKWWYLIVFIYWGDDYDWSNWILLKHLYQMKIRQKGKFNFIQVPIFFYFHKQNLVHANSLVTRWTELVTCLQGIPNHSTSLLIESGNNVAGCPETLWVIFQWPECVKLTALFVTISKDLTMSQQTML